MLAGKGGQHGWDEPIRTTFVSGGEGCRQRRPVAASGGAIGGGISTAINWVQRFHETGSVKPDQIGGYRPKKIAGPHREWLMQRCRKDFTVRGLVAELAERGLKVDYRTMWEFVHAEKLSYKKDADCRRAGSSRCRPPAGAVDQV